MGCEACISTSSILNIFRFPLICFIREKEYSVSFSPISSADAAKDLQDEGRGDHVELLVRDLPVALAPGLPLARGQPLRLLLVALAALRHGVAVLPTEQSRAPLLDVVPEARALPVAEAVLAVAHVVKGQRAPRLLARLYSVQGGGETLPKCPGWGFSMA